MVATLERHGALKKRALSALHKLPPFSPIFNKLMASLAGEDISFSKLGDLLEKDTVLAGSILQIVNSALYSRGGTVSSVRHALSILGVDKLRNSVLAISVSRTLNHPQMPPGWSMERFNMHSASVAILSDQIAQRVPVLHGEGAFVAGLLHDVGRLVIAIGLPVEFQRVLAQYEQNTASWLECERAVLGFTHPELSAEALTFWKVPEEIQSAVRQHHEIADFDPEGPVPLSRVVEAADRYVTASGDSVELPKDDQPQHIQTPWVEAFGLTEADAEQLLLDFHKEHRAMIPFFR